MSREGVLEDAISPKVDALSKVIRDDIAYGCMAWRHNYKNVCSCQTLGAKRISIVTIGIPSRPARL